MSPTSPTAPTPATPTTSTPPEDPILQLSVADLDSLSPELAKAAREKMALSKIMVHLPAQETRTAAAQQKQPPIADQSASSGLPTSSGADTSVFSDEDDPDEDGPWPGAAGGLPSSFSEAKTSSSSSSRATSAIDSLEGDFCDLGPYHGQYVTDKSVEYIGTDVDITHHVSDIKGCYLYCQETKKNMMRHITSLTFAQDEKEAGAMNCACKGEPKGERQEPNDKACSMQVGESYVQRQGQCSVQVRHATRGISFAMCFRRGVGFTFI